ncbi:MAG: glycosyl hydrolase family 5, partial [Acidobacteria bacterium]
DPGTFWKSNPYLDEHFTGEKNLASPQWLMIDLGEPTPIDAIRILWAQPFATNYSIEFGEFVGEEDLSQRLPTEWHTFPQGNIVKGTGGNALIKLASEPVAVKYVRIRLNGSSGTGPKSKDTRDRLGYAIREIYLGTLDSRGRLHDVIDHGTGRSKQTDIYVSSTDPWHREIDRDPETEQPGFDFIFKTGLTNGLPMLVPVPVLFDTPENAAAEIRYLQARGYPFERIEMGEEPDGQFINPEHYGALYLQFEKAIHKINPALALGGPSLQDIEQSQVLGRIEFGKAGWMGRFLAYLKRHGQLDKFRFFSFEWYPFPDDCRPEQLAEGTQMLTDALNELQQGGLTHDIPWLITEDGYSAFGARAEVDLDGALLNADSVGRFLTMGGEAAYLYGYEASEIIKEQECSSGNNMLFFRDDRGHIIKPTATYWGTRLLTQEWVQPGNQPHEIYPAVSDVLNGNRDQMITAYADHRPDDGLWSLLLINRDPDRAFQTSVIFKNMASGSLASFDGPLDFYQYSAQQYLLGGPPNNPYPVRSDPLGAKYL